jgi:hypothetical protein
MRVRLAGNVARMVEMREATKFLLGNLEEGVQSEDLGVDEGLY